MAKKTRKPSHGGKRAGAGRKPVAGENMVQVLTSLPAAIVEQLDARGPSRSGAIREIVEHALAASEKPRPPGPGS